MVAVGFADMDTRAPRSGETVSLLGYGIAPQDATIEVSDGNRLLLRILSSEGLAVGTALELQYLRDGDLHSVRGKLESRTGNMWWLDVEDVQRVQRRQHVRVPVSHKGTLLVPNPSGGEDAFLVDLVDVSAGGCAFMYDSAIVEGNRIELRFRVHDGRIHVKAIVLECRAAARGQYRVRCRFSDVASSDEERIAEWVLAQTRVR
jgi:PilZ domain